MELFRKHRNSFTMIAVHEANISSLLSTPKEGLRGVVSRKQLLDSLEQRPGEERATRIWDIASAEPLAAFADEPLGVVVRRMAESGFDPPSGSRSVGSTACRHDLARNDLLGARLQNLEDERDRERVLRIRMRSGRKVRRAETP